MSASGPEHRVHRAATHVAMLALLCAVVPGATGAAADAQAVGATPAFANVFGNGMVLPHGERVTLRGTAAPGTRLTLQVNDRHYSFRSSSAGQWQVEVQPLRAGGPYTLALKDEAGVGTTLTDVLAGEVWLCSGQSNMEFAAAMSTDQPPEVMQGHPGIRLLSVAQQTAPQARDSFAQAPTWRVATADSIRRFSAVCYFFAHRKIAAEGVPIGLINASWGGSAIAAWIGEKSLEPLPEYRPRVQLLRQYRTSQRGGELAFADQWVRWWQSSSDMGEVWQRGVLDGHADWQPAPLKDWRTYPDARLKNFTGNLWYSASFELSEAQSRKGARFVLGRIDEVDTTWLNGRFVANTFGYGTRREYALEPGLLKAGANQFSVFVTSTYEAGGMLGPESDVGIRFDDGEFIALGGSWKYRMVPKQTGYPPRAPWESVSGIGTMFNGMIAPLRPLVPTGVIWYQGESNVDKGGPYDQVLTALIKDWRVTFGRELPFLVVQLPNYGSVATTPVESGWAGVRHAQQQVALRDAKVGLVVTHDLGDDADIHPRLKFAVAERALQAERAMRGGGGSADGVIPQITELTHGAVLLEFTPPLTADSTTQPVAGFELCGAQPGTCTAVAATQRGSRVEIDRAALPNAARLRYCWSDGGTCALRTLAGLPVSSFELPLRPARR